MHIVFVTSEIPKKNNYGGGLATFTANIAKIFASKGNQVEILYVTTKPQEEDYDCEVEVRNVYIKKSDWDVYDNVSRIYYGENNADDNRREILCIMKAREVRDEIYKINKECKVDIVHFCNHGSFSMLMDGNIPYVIRISGFLNIWLGGAATPYGSIEYAENPLLIRDKLETYAMKKAPYVFAPSKLLADIGKKNLNIEVDVLESPFIMENMKWDEVVYQKHRLDEKKYLLFYGNLRYLKGIQVIADMVHNMLEKWKDLHMVLAGVDMEVKDDEGNMIKSSEYVKQRAGEYSDRVIYLGKLRRQELYPVITHAWACLLPSRIENLSNACIESMALGKVVIATDGASFEQLIVDGENGFLCKRDDAVSFFEGIDKVYGLTPEQKKRIESNARNTVKRLAPDVVYENFLNYYQKAIGEYKRRDCDESL